MCSRSEIETIWLVLHSISGKNKIHIIHELCTFRDSTYELNAHIAALKLAGI